MKDLRQRKKYSEYLKSADWIIEKVNGSFVYIKKIPFLGSVMKIQRPEKFKNAGIKELRNLERKYKVFQTIIEPKNRKQEEGVKKYGFRKGKYPGLPTKTIYLDLKQSKKKLLSQMHRKTRYNIKIAKKRGVKINVSKDIKGFSKFWQECARSQRGMFLSEVEKIQKIYLAFGEDAVILETTIDQEIVAAVLLLIAEKKAYYMYAAASTKGKKLFAPTLVAWESIQLAKKRKCTIYDFEGIYDERFPLETWRGFTRFKKSFGGRIVNFPGPFVRYNLLGTYF